MRGKSRPPAPPACCGRNALVQRHARLTPNNLARCVLTPRCSRWRDLRVNFPLSTYSVFGEKNVSRENENNLGGATKGDLSLSPDKTASRSGLVWIFFFCSLNGQALDGWQQSCGRLTRRNPWLPRQSLRPRYGSRRKHGRSRLHCACVGRPRKSRARCAQEPRAPNGPPQRSGGDGPVAASRNPAQAMDMVAVCKAAL